MKSIGRQIRNAYAFAGVTGLWWYLWHELYGLLTRAPFWERVLIRKLRGRKLAISIRGLGDFHSKDLVSVVLPVNNGRTKGVDRLVASLKTQTHKHIEFIAVDSGSTDGTVPWLKSEGFQVIEIEPKSFTHAFSRNTGAAAAKGKYILFVVDDVVFSNPDWLRCALYLLEHLDADSMSSRQAIDDDADAYARCLDSFLSTGQAERLTVNVSRNSVLTRWLHRHLPLHAQFRSVAIDDTNHLVRRETFDRIRFHAPTVEDIDFALRLTISGGRTLYTNMLTVAHYHVHNMDTLSKYARRVYIDSRVISKWQPYMIRFSTREALLVAGFHVLGVFLQAFKDLDKEMSSLSEHRRKYSDDLTVSEDYVDALIRLTELLDSSKFRAMKFRNYASFNEALKVFIDILGDKPPSDLYRNEAIAGYLIRRLRNDMLIAKRVVFQNAWELGGRHEVKTVFHFLWANRMMSYMARPEIFGSIEIHYPCDELDIGSWA